MSLHHKPWVGYLLATIGVLGLLAEISLHFLSFFTNGANYELNHGVLIISMVIGFVGFFIINPKGAEGGTAIITKTAVAIIGVVRGGRRATDPEVVVVEPEPDVQPLISKRKGKKATFDDAP